VMMQRHRDASENESVPRIVASGRATACRGRVRRSELATSQNEQALDEASNMPELFEGNLRDCEVRLMHPAAVYVVRDSSAGARLASALSSSARQSRRRLPSSNRRIRARLVANPKPDGSYRESDHNSLAMMSASRHPTTESRTKPTPHLIASASPLRSAWKSKKPDDSQAMTVGTSRVIPRQPRTNRAVDRAVLAR